MVSHPLIIAHRGASAYAPENSLEAFELAISMGADMIELDVRRTADGVLVVNHDRDWHGERLADRSYRDIGAAPGVPPVPPRLDEVLDLTAGRIQMDVELKEEGYEASVLDVLVRHLPISDYVVTSFSKHSIRNVKGSQSGVRTGLLVPSGHARRNGATVARECGADFVAPRVDRADVILAQAAEIDMPAYVWTINAPWQLVRYQADPSVAGIITDVPDVARRIRDSASSRAA